jgi:hypothetical protein
MCLLHCRHFYPFDKQVVRIILSRTLLTSNQTGCDASVVEWSSAALQRGEWEADGKPRARWLVGSVVATENDECTLDVSEGACVIEIPLRRVPLAVVIGHLIPCLIVVFAGLGALWIDPSMPPLVGARVGLMVTAMLVVGNMSKSVRLRLETVMWMDYFSVRGLDSPPTSGLPYADPPTQKSYDRASPLQMTQFVLLLLNLLGTLVVHVSRRTGHKTRAAFIDEALRTCALSAYLGYMSSVFTYGFTRSGTVFAFLCVVSRLDPSPSGLGRTA